MNSDFIERKEISFENNTFFIHYPKQQSKSSVKRWGYISYDCCSVSYEELKNLIKLADYGINRYYVSHYNSDNDRKAYHHDNNKTIDRDEKSIICLCGFKNKISEVLSNMATSKKLIGFILLINPKTEIMVRKQIRIRCFETIIKVSKKLLCPKCSIENLTYEWMEPLKKQELFIYFVKKIATCFNKNFYDVLHSWDIISEKEIKLLHYLLGINDGKQKTLEEASSEFGLSVDRIVYQCLAVVRKINSTTKRLEKINKQKDFINKYKHNYSLLIENNMIETNLSNEDLY